MNIKKLYSNLLLFVIGVTIVPVETFHHHHEESIVCNELEAHIEEPVFECEFADFVLPVYEETHTIDFTVFSTLQTAYAADNTELISKQLFLLSKYRGPPQIFA